MHKMRAGATHGASHTAQPFPGGSRSRATDCATAAQERGPPILRYPFPIPRYSAKVQGMAFETPPGVTTRR